MRYLELIGFMLVGIGMFGIFSQKEPNMIGLFGLAIFITGCSVLIYLIIKPPIATTENEIRSYIPKIIRYEKRRFVHFPRLDNLFTGKLILVVKQNFEPYIEIWDDMDEIDFEIPNGFFYILREFRRVDDRIVAIYEIHPNDTITRKHILLSHDKSLLEQIIHAGIPEPLKEIILNRYILSKPFGA